MAAAGPKTTILHTKCAVLKLSGCIPGSGFELLYDDTSPTQNGYYQAYVEIPKQKEFPEIPPSVWTLKIARDGDVVRSVLLPPSTLQGELTSKVALQFRHSLTVDTTFRGSIKFTDGEEGWVAAESDAADVNRPSRSSGTVESSIQILDCDWVINVEFSVSSPHYMPPPRQITSLCVLADQFAHLRENEILSDCQLVSRDGKVFPAHRASLAARSSVFAAMFQHALTEKISGQCDVKDFDGDVVEVMLQYVYTSRVENIAEIVESVFLAAEKYDLQDLRDICERTMISQLTAENAIRALGFAKQFNLQTLKVKAARLIGDQAKLI